MVVLQLLLIVPFGPEILQLPASDAPSRWNRDHAKPAAPIISSATPTLRMALRPRVPIRRLAARTMIENHSDECTAYAAARVHHACWRRCRCVAAECERTAARQGIPQVRR